MYETSCGSDAENCSIMLRPISNAPHLYLQPSHWWHSVLVLIVDDIFLAISPVFWSKHQHLTHPEPSIPLCVCHASENSPNVPLILITTDLVQCAYPRMTRSSAALQKSRPSESWMRLGAKDVTLKICSSYSEFKELTQKNIFSLIRQFMVSHKLIQCSKSKI